ncbi:MAG: hypothetical protein KBE23_09780 [Chloroflexi bacterium]|nr:hypothetical protein [Chloroflexota bacterium]MBP7043022.1 hypothetical protein [Chloroflexota bacterium]
MSFWFRGLALVIPIVLSFIGYLEIKKRIQRLEEKKEFAVEFLNRLVEFVNSGGKDEETYSWLVQRSPKLQTEMGHWGVSDKLLRPYDNVIVSNYPLILNGIPEIYRCLVLSQFSARIGLSYANMVRESIYRYVGIVNDWLKAASEDIRNPIIWLREGVKQLLLLPFLVLEWVGIVTSKTVSSFSNSAFLKFVGGVITIIGLIGSVVTIVTGWAPFLQWINNIMR